MIDYKNIFKKEKICLLFNLFICSLLYIHAGCSPPKKSLFGSERLNPNKKKSLFVSIHSVKVWGSFNKNFQNDWPAKSNFFGPLCIIFYFFLIVCNSCVLTAIITDRPTSEKSNSAQGALFSCKYLIEPVTRRMFGHAALMINAL